MYSSANSTFLYINGGSLHGYVTVVTGFLRTILSMIGFSCFVCTCKLTKSTSSSIIFIFSTFFYVQFIYSQQLSTILQL